MQTHRLISPRRTLFLFTWLALISTMILCVPARLMAQNAPDAERERAFQLWEASNFVEAIPLLQKLSVANPRDTAVLSRLGFALYASATLIKDPAARQQIYDQARQVLLQSNEYGDDSNLTQITLETLSTGGDAVAIPFSNIRAAEKAMRAGEAAFVQGDLDKALANYQRALELDPKLYDAALYAGDMYFKKGHAEKDPHAKNALMDKSGEWFARAIAINENRETAHRYWGDALKEQGKQQEARDKFIEAIIAEPYGQRAYVGLTQWADENRITLGHPKIEVPTSVTPLKDGKMTINLDPKMLDKNNNDDGTATWMMYGLVRASWATEKFVKEFPQEKSYRHTLREEAEALRAVVESISVQKNDGKVKSLDPSLANLLAINQAGLLEAYILFARPDRGIAQDYPAYRRAHRDKLHRYWAEFVVHEGK